MYLCTLLSDLGAWSLLSCVRPSLGSHFSMAGNGLTTRVGSKTQLAHRWLQLCWSHIPLAKSLNTPLAHVVASLSAIHTGGIFPSSHWHRCVYTCLPCPSSNLHRVVVILYKCYITSFSMLSCCPVVLLSCCPVVLLYCCTVLLQPVSTPACLITFMPVLLSCCHVVLLSCCPVVLLSCCPAVLLIPSMYAGH